MARKILFIIDPIPKLDPQFDTSLGLLRVFHERGCETWTCDTADLAGEKDGVYAAASATRPLRNFRYQTKRPKKIALDDFQMILMRKEPPFDAHYVASTYLLELVSPHVFVSNHPSGIRNTNEKVGILNFPKWIPRTLVSSDISALLSFRASLEADLVLKPLDLKGGSGVQRIRRTEAGFKAKLERLTKGGRIMLMAQEFLGGPDVKGDKRILLLNGDFLTAYEKHFKKGEFRANISLGGTIHPTTLTREEKALIADLRPYILKQGLHLTGVDVMLGKLIEINVTCPAGIMEAKLLYPRLALIEAWADLLEKQARKSAGI